MSSMNIVILVGNLGADPETRTPGGGMVVTNLNLATSSRQKKDDEWVEVTDWHRVVCFGKVAENVARFQRKGSKISVRGRISYRSWTDSEGVKKYMTEILADEVGFLSPRADGQEHEQEQERPAPKQAQKGGSKQAQKGGSKPAPKAAPRGPAYGPDDDIPF